MNRSLIGIALILTFLSAIPVMAQYSKEILPASTSGSPWMLVVSRDGGVDNLRVVNNNWTEAYYLFQNECTPSFFALTYNTLKEAWINDDKVKFTIYYDGDERITGVVLKPL